MRLARYLQLTYLSLFTSISIGLTVLFNLIQCIEKILYTNASTSSVVHFIVLNLAPSWLTLFPISCWLSMVATLHHLESHAEWQVCQVLGIAKRYLIRPFIWLFAGVILAVLCGKHMGLDHITWRAQRVYEQAFNKRNKQTVTQQWCHLSNSTTATVNSFDQKSNRGTGLTIYTHNANNHLVSVTHAEQFTVVQALFYSPQAIKWHAHTGKQEHVTPFIVRLPAMATLLMAHQPAHSLIDHVMAWWHCSSNDIAHKKVLRMSIINDIQPLLFGFLVMLLTLITYLLLSSQLVFSLLTYPTTLLIASLVQFLSGSIPLANSMVCITLTTGIFALAKAKNSRILRAVA